MSGTPDHDAACSLALGGDCDCRIRTRATEHPTDVIPRTVRNIIAMHGAAAGNISLAMTRSTLERLSVDPFKLGVDLEDVFGICIGDDDIAAWTRVADVVDFIERCVASRAAERLAAAAVSTSDEPCLGLSAREPLAPRVIEYLGLSLVQEIEYGSRPREDLAQAVEWFDIARAMRAWGQPEGSRAHLLRSEHFRKAEDIVQRLTVGERPA